VILIGLVGETVTVDSEDLIGAVESVSLSDHPSTITKTSQVVARFQPSWVAKEQPQQ